MRCSCQVCGTYMVQSEGLEKGCVCSACMARCKQCLGTDSVVPREALSSAALRFLEDAVMLENDALYESGAVREDDDDPYRD